jgi:hypothetical protein
LVPLPRAKESHVRFHWRKVPNQQHSLTLREMGKQNEAGTVATDDQHNVGSLPLVAPTLTAAKDNLMTRSYSTRGVQRNRPYTNVRQAGVDRDSYVKPEDTLISVGWIDSIESCSPIRVKVSPKQPVRIS